MTTKRSTPQTPNRAATRALFGRLQALAALQGVVAAVEALVPSTQGHAQRVADLAVDLAAECGGFSTGSLAALHEAALLHDVGKLAVPSSILGSSCRLTPAEYDAVKCHAALGGLLVSAVLTPSQAQLVRHHHERWDGTGYPDGIALRDLPPGVSVLSLADSFDAMAHRPYSGVLGKERAVEECIRHSGTQFAPAAVRALVRLADRGALPSSPPPSAGGGL